MKIKLTLESPANLSGIVTSTSPNIVTLNWLVVEDDRAYEEIQILCREVGSNDFVLCNVSGVDDSSAMLEYIDNAHTLPFLTGHSYEFVVVSYGPVFPVGPGDSPYSNTALVEF